MGTHNFEALFQFFDGQEREIILGHCQNACALRKREGGGGEGVKFFF
jgi:hypothetical protein